MFLLCRLFYFLSFFLVLFYVFLVRKRAHPLIFMKIDLIALLHGI